MLLNKILTDITDMHDETSLSNANDVFEQLEVFNNMELPPIFKFSDEFDEYCNNDKDEQPLNENEKRDEDMLNISLTDDEVAKEESLSEYEARVMKDEKDIQNLHQISIQMQQC